MKAALNTSRPVQQHSFHGCKKVVGLVGLGLPASGWDGFVAMMALWFVSAAVHLSWVLASYWL